MYETRKWTYNPQSKMLAIVLMAEVVVKYFSLNNKDGYGNILASFGLIISIVLGRRN